MSARSDYPLKMLWKRKKTPSRAASGKEVFEFSLPCVLVLTGTERIFSIVALMGLCLGFVLEQCRITQGCFHYCWAHTESQPFLLLTPTHQPRGWGCTRSWERTQPGQLNPDDPRDIPEHVAPWPAYRAGGGGRREEVHSEWWCLFPQVTITCDAALPSWEWLNTCPAMGSSELIPCFALLTLTAFTSPVKLFISTYEFSEFSHFYTFNSPAHRSMGTVSNWLCGA